MLGLGFLAQNLALGLTYGTYSAFVLHFTEDFDAPMSLAGSGLGLTALIMGITSPWTGVLVSRRPIAHVMIAGALIMAVGFALLAVAPSMLTALGAFCLVGLGMVLLGPIPCMSLITNWFQEDRGKAIGLGMVPLGIFVMPPLAALAVETLGWRVTALGISGILLLCTPILLSVRSHPPERTQEQSEADAARPSIPLLSYLRDQRFLWIVCAYAVVSGGGGAIAAHMIPLGRELGYEASVAALLLSVFGFASASGSFLFGWIADRLNAHAALLLNALLHGTGWLLLLNSGSYAMAVVIAVIIGLGAGGITIAISARLGEIYEPQRYAQAIGLTLAMNMPFTFGTAPFMGWMYDMTGGYGEAMTILALLYLAAGAVFAISMLRERRLAPVRS